MTRQEGFYKADFIGEPLPVSGQRHKKHRNMGDRTMISGRQQAHDRRILHRQRQQPRKSTFHRASLVVNRLEALRTVIDGVPNTGRQPEEIIASFLGRKFRMAGGTEKILAAISIPPVERTGVLKVGPAMNRHPAPTVHLEIGGAEDRVFLEAKGIVLAPARVKGNDRSGFHLTDDVGQDVFGVIVGVADDILDGKGQRLDRLKQRDGDFLFIMIGRISEFMERELGVGIDEDVVSISPEEDDLALEWLGKVDFDAEAGVGIAARGFRLVETVLGRGFEVVLPDVGLDRTGVEGNDFARDDFFLDQDSNQSLTEGLEFLVGCCPEKKGKTFSRGRMMERREAAGRRRGGVVFQFEGQLGQGRQTAEMAVDEGPEERFAGKGRAAAGVVFLSPGRKMREQLLETYSRWKVLGLKKRFHDTLDFRAGRLKKVFSRVSKRRKLGYLVDSYQRRLRSIGRGVSRKSSLLTRSKKRSENGKKHEFNVADTSALC